MKLLAQGPPRFDSEAIAPVGRVSTCDGAAVLGLARQRSGLRRRSQAVRPRSPPVDAQALDFQGRMFLGRPGGETIACNDEMIFFTPTACGMRRPSAVPAGVALSQFHVLPEQKKGEPRRDSPTLRNRSYARSKSPVARLPGVRHDAMLQGLLIGAVLDLPGRDLTVAAAPQDISVRRRLQRLVLLQPRVPPALWCRAFGDTPERAAARLLVPAARTALR